MFFLLQKYYFLLLLAALPFYAVLKLAGRKFRAETKRYCCYIPLATVYFCLLFYVLLGRSERWPEHRYTLEIFWSYRLALDGDSFMQQQILQNIMAFLPLGVLSQEWRMQHSRTSSRWKKRWEVLWIVAGAVWCSGMVEIVQLITRLGWFEFDDIISNAAGTAMGAGLAAAVDKLVAFGSWRPERREKMPEKP